MLPPCTTRITKRAVPLRNVKKSNTPLLNIHFSPFKMPSTFGSSNARANQNQPDCIKARPYGSPFGFRPPAFHVQSLFDSILGPPAYDPRNGFCSNYGNGGKKVSRSSYKLKVEGKHQPTSSSSPARLGLWNGQRPQPLKLQTISKPVLRFCITIYGMHTLTI